MPELNQRLAEAVLRRRRERGWTQQDVTAQGGPSDTTLGKVESGEGSVGAKTLTQLDAGLKWERGKAAALLTEGSAMDSIQRHPSRSTGVLAAVKEAHGWASEVLDTMMVEPPPGSVLPLFSDEQIGGEVVARFQRKDAWAERLADIARRDEGGSDAGTTREKSPSPGEPGNVRPLTPREERRQRMIEQGMPVETAADRDRDD